MDPESNEQQRTATNNVLDGLVGDLLSTLVVGGGALSTAARRLCGSLGLLDLLGDHIGDHRALTVPSPRTPSRLSEPSPGSARRLALGSPAMCALPDMSLPVPFLDARRIEIVCNGLPVWHGAQLAVDTTCVSPGARSGELGLADSQPSCLALQQATRRRCRDTCPERAGALAALPPRCVRCRKWRPLWSRARNLPQAPRTSAGWACARCRAAYVFRWNSISAVGGAKGPRQLLARAPARHRRLRCRRACWAGGPARRMLAARPCPQPTPGDDFGCRHNVAYRCGVKNVRKRKGAESARGPRRSAASSFRWCQGLASRSASVGPGKH